MLAVPDAASVIPIWLFWQLLNLPEKIWALKWNHVIYGAAGLQEIISALEKAVHFQAEHLEFLPVERLPIYVCCSYSEQHFFEVFENGGYILNQDKQKYGKLFLSTFQLSACTFGGGFVIIPLMRKKFVEELHWIEEQEMMDLTAIAQSSPGAIAVNASILVGYHVAGVIGALITVLGTVLPPLLIISVISLFYTAFRDNPIVNMAMAGMLAGVAAVICDVVITMGKEILNRKRIFPVLVLIGSFAAVRFFEVNIILIILLCGVLGAIDTLYHDRKRGEMEK